MWMAKNIAISDDIYKALSKIKRPNESFSEVIRRLLPGKSMLQDLIGRKTFTQEEWSEVKQAFVSQKQLDERRKKSLLGKISTNEEE